MSLAQVWIVTDEPAWLLRADRIVSLFVRPHGSEHGPERRQASSSTDVSVWAEVTDHDPVCLDSTGNPRHAATDLADLITALGCAARVSGARGPQYVARTQPAEDAGAAPQRTRWETRVDAPVELLEIDLWGGRYEETHAVTEAHPDHPEQ